MQFLSIKIDYSSRHYNFDKPPLIGAKKFQDRVYTEAKCGFRAPRSTTDSILTIRQLQEKSREKRVPLCMAFVDLIRAFDLLDQKIFIDRSFEISLTSNPFRTGAFVSRWHASAV